MREQYIYICFLLLFISEYKTQDTTPTSPLPDWHGDPNLCTINSLVTPSSLPQPPFPILSNKAEFAFERVGIDRVLGVQRSSNMILYEYLYDYDANKVIIVKNNNSFIDTGYIYYNTLKKATYSRGEFCEVTDIPVNDPLNGESAIQLPDGTWHVRPLNEYLLFSSNRPGQELTPIYLGKDIIRGIPVDKWQSCSINKTDYRTVRRIWYFAQQGYIMPTGPVGEYAVPIQGVISASYTFPNGTSLFEINNVYNIYAFRPGIIETADALAPPKGVFCSSGEGQNLISLKDAGVSWPDRFSVRVEASSSGSAQWQQFHLYYDNNRMSNVRRLRYDYMPVGAEDFVTVIYDYNDQITYTIDRRLGSCKIDQGVSIPDVNPIRDPIRFFIKNEDKFIFSPPKKAWELNGFRRCRGNSIHCTILTTSVDHFPVIVDSDTDKPTGETWLATNVEYAWSMRSPYARPPPAQSKQFDYPVSLYLKMYRFQNLNDPSPYSLRTEDIEYEFYEMSRDRQQNDFDISICYRSLDQPYLHLGFVLKPSNDALVDGKYLNRRELELNVRNGLINAMQISRLRISDVELNHIQSDNSVYVLFTLIGPIPFSTGSGPSVEIAQNSLQTKINTGGFMFEISLIDNKNSKVQFKAQSNTLKTFQQFMSIHADSILNCNTSNTLVSTPTTAAGTNITTITPPPHTITGTTITPPPHTDTDTTITPPPHTDTDTTITPPPHTDTDTTITPPPPTRTPSTTCPVQIIVGPPIKKEKYTGGAQAGGIIGGLIVGIVLGLIGLLIPRYLRKRSTSSGNGITNVSFTNRRVDAPLTMQNTRG